MNWRNLTATLVLMLPLTTAWGFSLPRPASDLAAGRLLQLEMRAANDDTDAQFLLGLMYVSGRHVPQSPDSGLMWLSRAAARGHDKAQKTIADLRFEGQLVTRNLAEAERWYLKMSQRGETWAHFRLGFIYAAGGDGVERNCGRAIEQFELAGDPVSLGNVAWILATCPESQYRDGSKARALASKLLDDNANDPTNLDNLAAAYAELGQFEQAVDLQQQAIAALAGTEESNKAEEYHQRLEYYRQQRPYRETVPLY